MRQRVLITGAAGNIGRKVSAHLRAQGRAVFGLDRRDGPFVDLRADLSQPDPLWMETFAGQDAIVHLAANGDPAMSVEQAERNQAIDCNVAAACARHGIPRLIFGSSQWTMQGYFEGGEVREDLPPTPLTFYGRKKAETENDLRHLAGTVLCIRIGYVMPDNRRWRLPPNEYDRHVWLSDRDLCAAVEGAIDSRFAGYAILNITSANRRSRWPIDRARELIGFAPKDGTSRVDVLWAKLRPPGSPWKQGRTRQDANQ